MKRLADDLYILEGFPPYAINVYLLAPVWMQLLHLFIADILWIVTVVLSAEAMIYPARAAESQRRGT